MKENLMNVIQDSYDRLLFPSIENEVRGILTSRSDIEAINIFQLTLKHFYYNHLYITRQYWG